MNAHAPGYRTFGPSDACDYLRHLGLFTANEPLECDEIGDGNLNLVFRVRGAGKSLIVKQALPYAKVVGENWPLSLDRARIEGEALLEAAKVVPAHLPKVHQLDPVLALTVMEDLSHLTIGRAALIQGRYLPLLGGHIGDYLARTLYATSHFALTPREAKALAARFVNPDLCNITEDLVFIDPYFDRPSNDFPEALRPTLERHWADQALKREVAELTRLFLCQGEALIHGDLHTGSLFVSESDTRVIDPEFAYYGPMAFDIGAFWANLILSSLSHRGHGLENEARRAYRHFLYDTLETSWRHFERGMREQLAAGSVDPFAKVEGYFDAQLERWFSEAIGFAGCKAFRRIVGLAHVADIESIQDPAIRLEVKEDALELAANLIKRRGEFAGVEALRAYLESAIDDRQGDNR